MKLFRCFLITPDEILAEEDVLMVTLPGIEGEVGILQDHAPMLLTLGAGTVCFYDQSLETCSKRYSINSGFAHVREVETHILVTEASPLV